MAKLSIDYDELEDESILDELDDFDSDDFWKPTRRAQTDYLDDMWGRWTGTTTRREDAIITAHGMVTSFINSFARDGIYQVIFDPNMSTAGTDMETRRVLITPAPILDESITTIEAGRVLTGLAVHEISHPRYGRGTHDAVKRAFPRSRAAARISNMLDDLRIEQRFIDDYPGYAGVFQPTLDYVSKGLIAKNGGKLFQPKMSDQLNIMSAAVRYESSSDWSDPDVARERDWWKAWAAKWSKEDAPRRHVEAVREALRHIVKIKLQLELEAEAKGDAGDASQQKSDSQGESGEKGQDSGYEDDDTTGEAGDGDDDEKIDADGLPGSGGSSLPELDEAIEQGVEGLDDDALGEAGDEGDNTPMSQQMPTCAGRQSVEQSATQQGVESHEIADAKQKAQAVIEEAEFYEDDGLGGKIDVARSLKSLINGPLYNRFSRHFQKSDIAARYVRDALLQSRTGHEATAHYQKRGRLDHRALHRVTTGDFRLFDRKTAESPGRYNIWMLLDRSGSMDGYDSVNQAAVATAIADASRYVPTIRASVWAWSDSFRSDYSYRAGVALAWQTGQPTSQIAKTIDLKSGGTPDSQIMSWAWRAIKRDTRRGETPVILMCSDGWGASNLGQMVAEARLHGVQVYSVAFGRLDVKSQTERFGRDGFVAWNGSIVQTARPLAKLIARIVGRDRRS